MRYYRNKLEEDIINDRMVLWVSRVLDRKHRDLLPFWSNFDDNPSRRRSFWRSQLRKEDLLEILVPLRPGVDIQTIVNEDEDDESEVWKRWLYDAAAWLAGRFCLSCVTRQLRK